MDEKRSSSLIAFCEGVSEAWRGNGERGIVSHLQCPRRTDRVYPRGCLSLFYADRDGRLGVGNCVVLKTEQKPLEGDTNWKNEFALD